MKKSDMFWQTYLNLENNLVDIGRYVLISDVSNSDGWRNQLDVFSPHIADLLVSCCIQIEAISKELYFTLGGKKERESNELYFDQDCLQLIDQTWDVSQKVVNVSSPIFYLTKDENKILYPLKNSWRRKGTNWEKAYQAVKHDRYKSMPKGNIKALICATAALYLLNIYYRNDSWLTNHNALSSLDWSMGSSIFSVLPPAVEGLWYGNQPIKSKSPFIATYTEDGYSRIKEIQDREDKAVNEYLSKLPEFNDPRFDEWFKEHSSKLGYSNRAFEVAVYRINKNIPPTLSFEARKRLLIQSPEWKLHNYISNNPYKDDEVNESNIQSVIDSCGRFCGMREILSVQKLEWVHLATTYNICRVYIPPR